MNWKSYVLVSGAGVIATYLVSGPPRPVETTAARQTQARPAVSIDIQEQAVRLQSRSRAQRLYSRPLRNPFSFSARPVSRASDAAGASTAAAAAAPAAPMPPRPVISLVGVASDDVDGAVQRTAILSTGQGVLLVREGEAVGADYTVATVEEGAVELISTADGSRRRITFKP
jgi:hypothetical protein